MIDPKTGITISTANGTGIVAVMSADAHQNSDIAALISASAASSSGAAISKVRLVLHKSWLFEDASFKSII